MAHFAELDDNNVVLRVIVVRDRDNSTPDGVEDESIGIAFCRRLFGGRWVQTSYNNNFRKRYAGIGYTYHKDLDAFSYPKPDTNPSWVLNPATVDWEPPIPRPTDGHYSWNEETLSWNQVPQPYPSWTLQGDPLVWTAPIPRPIGKPYKWDEATQSWVEIPDQT